MGRSVDQHARRRRLTRTLIRRYGRTYAEDAGISLRDTPGPLFQLLYTALLLSARIPAGNAVQAARALRRAGLTTPKKMAEASWQDRVDVITWHGYKRYDERAATMLGDSAEMVLRDYQGDLRKLRRAAAGNVEVMGQLLQRFKGIGPVGARIFLREVQGIWPEVYPFIDERVVRAAEKLGLPKTALPDLVKKGDFVRLASGLVRADLMKGIAELEQQAA